MKANNHLKCKIFIASGPQKRIGHLYTTGGGVELLDTVVYKCTVGSRRRKSILYVSVLSRRSRFTPFYSNVHVYASSCR